MENIEIRLLEFPTCIRERSGMYIGGVDDSSVLLREVIDNAFDESYSWKGCNQILIDQNWSNSGYQVVMDNGRGIPITMSPDRPEDTMACVAVSSLHSGSKFDATDTARNGMNGCGESAVNALSESFILMSKITENNYNKSIPAVKKAWDKTIRGKKELYYIVVFERGIKVFEGADKLSNLEEKIFQGQQYEPLPRGYSTIAMFRPDPTIFDKVTSKVPIKNIQYFLMIQEKFYKKKVDIIVNGVHVRESFKPYQFELIKTIVPADTSKNKTVSVYVTYEVDPQLGNKIEEGSVSGLVVEQGVHINYMTQCFEAALKSEYKIQHKYILNGLKICVVILAGNVIFDSQTKTRLKSITKVKVTDFGDVVKEFIKNIRQNKDYWDEHVDKLNQLAESMKSISASDKAKRIVESNTGNSFYKSKLDLVDGFAEATAPKESRFDCELFLCEGLSPAGSLKSGRKDTKFHAIMPLRGKVMNVSEKTAEQMLDNKELYTIFKVIGLGLDVYNVTDGCSSAEEAFAKLKTATRYGKIIVAVDSDYDGFSIMNALLYTFSKFARFLIEFGMVYVVDSPSYSQNGKYYYPSDPVQPGTVLPVGINPNKPFKRYKGLGSFNKEDIYDVFYNPNTRRLIQVTPEGMNYSMSLVEDINQRKRLLMDEGIISNPYKFTDI